MSIDNARVYGDAEVEGFIGKLMAKLPVGSSVTYRIENNGATVTLDARVPGKNGTPDKREIFQHGWIDYGGTKNMKSKLGRQGPALSPAAITAIVRWSKS